MCIYIYIIYNQDNLNTQKEIKSHTVMSLKRPQNHSRLNNQLAMKQNNF